MSIPVNNQPVNFGKRWTPKEIDIVNQFADSLKSQDELAERSPEVAESLGRPISSVQYKVEKRRKWYSRNTAPKSLKK